jgi:hypothetical protein
LIENLTDLTDGFVKRIIFDSGSVVDDAQTKKITSHDLVTSAEGQMPTLEDYTYDLICKYVYLSEAERLSRVGTNFDMVIIQHQHQEQITSMTNSSTSFNVKLDLKLPMTCLHVLAQSSYRLASGQHGDFRGFADGHTTDNIDVEGHTQPLLKNLGLLFNNQTKIPLQDSRFFTGLQPSMHADRVPLDNDIHLISFGLGSPYEAIRGTINFSRIPSVNIHGQAHESAFTDDSAFGVDKTDQTIRIHAYGINANVLSFKQGHCIVDYTS